jgi:membrane-bound lytic murein transglycosylase D
LGKGKLLCCLMTVSLLTGCKTAEKRQATVQVPAPPPSLEPLPLKSSDQLLRSSLVPAPDPVGVLVQKVEDLYSSGMADYRQGNLEKAKEEFNQALATLLESNFDIQGDDRLSAEFDKLVENVYGAEAAALERGDSLTQTYEPAPIESFAGLTFPVDPRVKQQAQQELKSVRSDLPLVSNDYVDGVLTYFQGRGRKFVETVLERVGKYRPMIEEVLRKEGVPQDLIYLAAAESAFNPFAVSRAGAKGIWQFMLGTGQLYGLKKDRWVDDRQDPVKSTVAAARHLKDLYIQFGDWYLAMAAYDSGPLTVQRAIEKTGYADYWTLRRLGALPRETENYVPIFLATALIAKDPQSYGFAVQPASPLKPDQVIVDTPTDLRLIAQLVDHPVEDLVKLNPSLLRWTTPANDPQFVLNLPSGSKDVYESVIASIPADKRIWWRAYKVNEGDTLTSVAKKFHVSPAALAEVNQISREDSLEEGSHLVLPLAAGRESSLLRAREGGPRRLIHYRIRSGDTLELIADRFDVTPYLIRRWNRMKGSRLIVGRTLRLYVHRSDAASYRRSSVRRSKATTPSSVAKKKLSSSKPTLARKESRVTSKSAPAAALPVH